MLDVRQLVEIDRGIVDNRIFSDEEIYRTELERVFGHVWCFLGHESQLPRTGDYLSTYVGEDPVIVCRDGEGTLRAYLNKCSHRGNRICLFDRGNTRTFTCSFHGWSFNLQGKLTGVPFRDEAYVELDPTNLGLTEMRVATYAGLIFGTWDAGIASLDNYLGDLRWYLDNVVLRQDIGGYEVVPSKQRATFAGNWKLMAENFAGDHYHFFSTHASVAKIMNVSSVQPLPHYEVTVGLSGTPHSLGSLKVGEEWAKRDLEMARELGPEAIEWVEYRFRKTQELMRDQPTKIFSNSRAHIFPNFSLLRSGIVGQGMYLWLPRGPFATQLWQWCAVEKNAPQVLKLQAVQSMARMQSASGMIGVDDGENFERIVDNTRTTVASSKPFDYSMSLGRERSYPGHESWPTNLPGQLGPRFTEVNQRQLYRYWAELMERAN